MPLSKLADPPAAEEKFYIAAGGPTHRPRRVLKHLDAFAVLDSHGDMGAVAGGPDGGFEKDTRFISHLEMTINGGPPLLLGASVSDDNLNMVVDLTNPDFYAEGALVVAKDTFHLRRSIFLYDGVINHRVVIESFAETTQTLTLAFAFGNDFADIFEVRGMHRERRGRILPVELEGGTAVLSYMGLDSKKRSTSVCFDPPPSRLDTSIAAYAITLAPREKRVIHVAISNRWPGPKPSFGRDLRMAHRQRLQLVKGVAGVETDNTIFNAVLQRAQSDFYMLVSQTPDGSYPYAGIPWFSTTFGRDGIIAAMQMLWLDPSVARGVLQRLAALQATAIDPVRDAQPGKILHEMRGGEMAGLGEVPFGLYYGSVNSTPLFVMLLGLYLQRTGDIAFVRKLWPNAERALAWMDQFGDIDGDGFMEYEPATPQGLANQGWKDSSDSISHADGRLAEGPIALIEVQAYAYAARRFAALCARQLGEHELARSLARKAEQLRCQVEEAFWCDEINAYALALDGAKRRCGVLSSNAGHVLFCALASRERAHATARSLLDVRMASGWGIRTLSRDAGRYNPMSYHNGSVWPHDNAMIASGLAAYGEKEAAASILTNLLEAATHMDLLRLPELFCGFVRRKGRGPTLYPVACSPQAWAAGAPFMILQAVLGLRFVPASREIRLYNPQLPAGVREITIRHLSVGDGDVDFSVRRDGDALSVRVLRTSGAMRVSLMTGLPEN